MGRILHATAPREFRQAPVRAAHARRIVQRNDPGYACGGKIIARDDD
jgi:hypothetical protein